MPLKQVRIGERALDVWFSRRSARGELRQAVTSSGSRPPGSWARERLLAADDSAATPAASTRPRSGSACPSGKSNAARPTLPGIGGAALLPAKPAGDHQVKDHEQLARRAPRRCACRGGGARGRDGRPARRRGGSIERTQERARQPHRLERLTDDPRPRAPQIELDVGQFGHAGALAVRSRYGERFNYACHLHAIGNHRRDSPDCQLVRSYGMQYGAIPTRSPNAWRSRRRVPIPILDTLFGMLKARIVMAGVRLGVFEALAQESHTTASLAAALEARRDCLDLLLRIARVLRLSRARRRSLLALGARHARSMVERRAAGAHRLRAVELHAVGVRRAPRDARAHRARARVPHDADRSGRRGGTTRRRCWRRRGSMRRCWPGTCRSGAARRACSTSPARTA